MTFKIEISQFYDQSEPNIEMKQNQTSFHGAYLNLTAYLFL